MTKAYFSPSKLIFIPELWKTDGTYTEESWPSDAVLLTEEQTADYWKQNPPAGKQLGAVDELPSWVDTPPLTQEQLIAQAEQHKQQLISEAQQSISLLQTKLLMGRVLSDAEKQKVNTVLDYIDEVEAINTSSIPVNFPSLVV